MCLTSSSSIPCYSLLLRPSGKREPGEPERLDLSQLYLDSPRTFPHSTLHQGHAQANQGPPNLQPQGILGIICTSDSKATKMDATQVPGHTKNGIFTGDDKQVGSLKGRWGFKDGCWGCAGARSHGAVPEVHSVQAVPHSSISSGSILTPSRKVTPPRPDHCPLPHL